MTIQPGQLSVSHNANFINWTVRVKEYDLVLDRKTGELTAKISGGFNEKTGEEIAEPITIEQLVKESNIASVLLPNSEALSLINKREYFNRSADHYYLSHTAKSYEELKESGYFEFKRNMWAGACSEDDWKTMEEAFACGIEKARMAIAEEQTSGQKTSEQKTSEQKTSEQKTSEQKTSEHKTSEQKTSEQKTSEQKTSEQKTSEQKTGGGGNDVKYTVVEWDGAEWVGIATFESMKQVELFVSRAKTELASIRHLGEMKVCTDFSGIYPHGATIFSNLEESVKKDCN